MGAGQEAWVPGLARRKGKAQSSQHGNLTSCPSPRGRAQSARRWQSLQKPSVLISELGSSELDTGPALFSEMSAERDQRAELTGLDLMCRQHVPLPGTVTPPESP